MTQAERGRLFLLILARNAAARAEALASIRPLPGGRWQARIGGRQRGRTERFLGRLQAEVAVKEHYDAAAFQRTACLRARAPLSDED